MNTMQTFGERDVTVRSQVEIPLLGLEKPATFVSFDHLPDQKEHIVIALGDWQQQTIPLVRLHSECLTGDIFGSAKCDCGPQLDEATKRIAEAGGFIVYLRQEGRGIGLYNKLDAYRLQADGQDTYEANHSLGFESDLRNFKVAADMLKALGISRLKLLTNNPDKVSQLEQHGLVVETRLSTGVHENPHNQSYLRAKAKQMGHAIQFDDKS